MTKRDTETPIAIDHSALTPDEWTTVQPVVEWFAESMRAQGEDVPDDAVGCLYAMAVGYRELCKELRAKRTPMPDLSRPMRPDMVT